MSADLTVSLCMQIWLLLRIKPLDMSRQCIVGNRDGWYYCGVLFNSRNVSNGILRFCYTGCTATWFSQSWKNLESSKVWFPGLERMYSSIFSIFFSNYGQFYIVSLARNTLSECVLFKKKLKKPYVVIITE